MSRRVVIAVLFLAGVAGAYVLGRGAAPRAALPGAGTAAPQAPGEAEALRTENARLRAEIDAIRNPGAAPRGAGAAPAPDGGNAPALAPAPDLPAGDRPDLAGVSSAAEASARLMAFADAQLDRGPDGYLALLRMMSEIGKSEDLRRIFYDESVFVREIYPWVKFLVKSEGRVLDMTEWLFRSMAESPQSLAGLDNDPLEVFTEGIGAMLPGAIPPERLALFREYASKVLAIPEDQLPEAIRRNRGDLQRLLERYWTAPIDPASGFELLKAGGLDLTNPQTAALLRALSPEQIAQLDLPRILAPLLAEGRYEAIRLLGTLPANSLNPAALDEVVLRAVDEGKMNGGFLRAYLQATGRREWAQTRDFFERAISGSDKGRAEAVQLLAYLPASARPDKSYVEDVLRRYEFPDQVRTWLKGVYGIE